MELNLISLFVVIYLAMLLSDFTFFIFTLILNYYKQRKLNKNMDTLKRRMEEMYKDIKNTGNK